MNHCPSRNMLQLLKTTAIYKQEFVISSDITVGGICPLKIIAQGGDCILQWGTVSCHFCGTLTDPGSTYMHKHTL